MMKWLCMVWLLIGSSLIASQKEYIKLVDRITANFTKELTKEKNMYLFGYGGRMMFDVEEISMSYNVVKHASIDEARRLFVEVAERYLARINADEKLRPFLHNYPFTINNLDLGIGFENEKRQAHDDLAYVVYRKKTGKIVYNANDPKEDMFYKIYEEPYEEAVRLVNNLDNQ